jgi:hypothetical protein
MKTSRRALFKTLIKRKIGELFATDGSADVFMTTRKVYKRDLMAASLVELITRDSPGRPMRTLVQKLSIFKATVRKDGAGGLDIQIYLL